jgi:hypothetical protein
VTTPGATNEHGKEGFGPDLFGPSGWTDPFVEPLDAYSLPDPSDAWLEFYDVPLEVVATLGHLLATAEQQAGFSQWDYLFAEPARLAPALAQATGLNVTCSGKVVRPPRSDERIEITALQLTLGDHLAVDGALERTASVLADYPPDLTMAIDQTPENGSIHLVVYPPSER